MTETPDPLSAENNQQKKKRRPTYGPAFNAGPAVEQATRLTGRVLR